MLSKWHSSWLSNDSLNLNFHKRVMKMEDFTHRIYSGYMVERVNLTRATLKEANEFRKILDEHILYGNHNIIVDLSDCEFMDSTFIGVLVVTYKKLRSRGGDLKIVKPGLFANSILTFTGTMKYFDYFESVDDAIISINVPDSSPGFIENRPIF